MATISQLDTLGHVFRSVFIVAETPLNMFGYWIAPLDFWLTTVVIYMLIDILLYYVWGDKDG